MCPCSPAFMFSCVLAGKQHSEEPPGLCGAADTQVELKQSRSLIQFQTNDELQIKANHAAGQKVKLLKKSVDGRRV